MLKSYLVLLFIVCFLFSVQGEAKSKLASPEKKMPTIDRQYIKNAKIAAAKKKMDAHKAHKSRTPKPLFARSEKKIVKKTHQKKSPRKMVRLDFTEPPSAKKAPKLKNVRTLASVKSPTNKKLK